MEAVLEYEVRDGQAIDIVWHDTPMLAAVGTVYARHIGDEIVYVGKADRPLRKRMQEHLSWIRKGKAPEYMAYAEGKRVVIKAMKPGTVEAAGLTVDLTPSVERALMDAFNPRFNKRRG